MLKIIALTLFLVSNLLNIKIFADVGWPKTNDMNPGMGIAWPHGENSTQISKDEYLSNNQNQEQIAANIASSFRLMEQNSQQEKTVLYAKAQYLKNEFARLGLNQAQHADARDRILKSVVYKLAIPQHEYDIKDDKITIVNSSRTNNLNHFEQITKKMGIEVPSNFQTAKKLEDIYLSAQNNEKEFFEKIKSEFSPEDQIIALTNGMENFSGSKTYLKNSIKMMAETNNIDKNFLQIALYANNTFGEEIPGLNELITSHMNIDEKFDLPYMKDSLTCMTVNELSSQSHYLNSTPIGNIENPELYKEVEKFKKERMDIFLKKIETLKNLGTNFEQRCNDGQTPTQKFIELDSRGLINLQDSPVSFLVKQNTYGPCLDMQGSIDLASLCLNMEIIHKLTNNLTQNQKQMNKAKENAEVQFENSFRNDKDCTISTFENIVNKNGMPETKSIKLTISSPDSNNEFKMTLQDQESFKKALLKLINSAK